MVRLLIADDEVLERTALASLVEREMPGAFEAVDIAADGVEALRCVEEQAPHVALLDIRMPGCDGLQVARRIRERNRQAQVILLTAHAEFEFARQAIEVGVAHYLLKPFARDEVTRMLHQALEQIHREGLTGRAANDLALKLAGRVLLEELLQGRTPLSLLRESQPLLNLPALPTAVVLVDYPSGGEGDPHPISDRLTSALREIADGGLFAPLFPGRLGALAVVPSGEAGAARLRQVAGALANPSLPQLRIATGGPVEPESLHQALTDAFASLARFTKPAESESPLLPPPPSVAALAAMGSQAAAYRSCERALFRGHLRLTEIVHWGVELLDAARTELAERGLPTERVNGWSDARGRLLLRITAAVSFALWLEQTLRNVDELCAGQRASRAPSSIAEIAAHLESRYAEPLDLEQMARRAALSPAHFSRVFKQVTGTNFVQYLTGVRLRAAAELLRSPAATVDVVARLVGFQSHSYFTTVFKRHFGVTPTAFRAAQSEIAKS